jgi:hypothetical protein
MPEGKAVDVELRFAEELTRFQITTAYPEWDEPGDEARHGGYIRHALEYAGVNQRDKSRRDRVVGLFPTPEPDHQTSIGLRGISA